MFESLNHLLTRISLVHLNALLLLGLALFGGTVGGRVFQKLRIPQVVGYIVIGIIIGESGFKIISADIIEPLRPLNYFALGLIGFMVGGELKKSIFVKYGKQFFTILLCEGITPFILVAGLTTFIGTMLLGDWRLALSLGLLMGAIASATDPATTTQVMKEYKTKGPLTTTILGIVALDDGLALFLFAIASSLASTLSGGVHSGLLHSLLAPAYEIFGSILVGTLAGMILVKILLKYSEEERLLAFSIGAVLLVIGASLALHLEMLLATMTMGVVVVNFAKKKSEEIFKLVGAFTPPIYVLFFVLIGAKLNFQHLSVPTLILVAVYLFGTFSGKVVGSRFGAKISNAPKTVRKYLALGLFSQAGVAIGLSILAAQYFPGTLGDNLVVIITATTFFTQLIGPPFTKMAVTKAGEVGLNITEEDIIRQSKANDIMQKDFPKLKKNLSVTEILKIFAQTDNLYYPVVDNENKLIGVITVDNIKNSFAESSLSDFLLADDLMEPVIESVKAETPMAEVKETLDRHGLEFIPVVSSQGKLEGLIERRNFNRVISTKLMELRRKESDLEA